MRERPVLFVTTVRGIDEYRGKEADDVAKELERAFLSNAAQTTPIPTSSGANVMYVMRHVVKTAYMPKIEEEFE